jgi:hypothetical protein
LEWLSRFVDDRLDREQSPDSPDSPKPESISFTLISSYNGNRAAPVVFIVFSGAIRI